MTDNIKRLLIIPFVIYIVIFIMNVMGLPRGVCDAGNHVFVAVCFVFCAMAWKQTKDSLLLIFMALTLAADVLSGFPKVFAVGVVFFFASQIVLSMIIWRQNGGRHGWPIRVLLILAGLAGVYAMGLMSPLFGFGIVYLMWFLGNVVQVLAAGSAPWAGGFVPVAAGRLMPASFRLAMVLYFAADLCLIGNLLIPGSGLITTILTFGTWMPYLPAVLIIALSGMADS